MLGSVELVVLAAAGAFALGAHAFRARRRDGACRVMSRFLGDGAVRTAGRWSSADGSRRVRRSADGGLVFEERGTDGLTRAYRARMAAGPGAGDAFDPTEDNRVFLLHGRAIEPACFVGLPHRLGGRPRHVAAAHVHLLQRSDGVWLVRVDHKGRFVGDTTHATLAEARRQLRREYGPHLGPMRPRAPTEAPTLGWEGAADGVF